MNGGTSRRGPCARKPRNVSMSRIILEKFKTALPAVASPCPRARPSARQHCLRRTTPPQVSIPYPPWWRWIQLERLTFCVDPLLAAQGVLQAGGGMASYRYRQGLPKGPEREENARGLRAQARERLIGLAGALSTPRDPCS